MALSKRRRRLLRRAACARARYAAHVAAGLCGQCGGPVTAGRACEPCHERGRASTKRRAAERDAAGLCARCSQPRTVGTRCEGCAARDNAKNWHWRGRVELARRASEGASE